jgi:hypothetical protein
MFVLPTSMVVLHDLKLLHRNYRVMFLVKSEYCCKALPNRLLKNSAIGRFFASSIGVRDAWR